MFSRIPCTRMGRFPQCGLRLVRLLSSNRSSTCVRALVRISQSPCQSRIFVGKWRFYHTESGEAAAVREAADGTGSTIVAQSSETASPLSSSTADDNDTSPAAVGNHSRDVDGRRNLALDDYDDDNYDDESYYRPSHTTAGRYRNDNQRSMGGRGGAGGRRYRRDVDIERQSEEEEDYNQRSDDGRFSGRRGRGIGRDLDEDYDYNHQSAFRQQHNHRSPGQWGSGRDGDGRRSSRSFYNKNNFDEPYSDERGLHAAESSPPLPDVLPASYQPSATVLERDPATVEAWRRQHSVSVFSIARSLSGDSRGDSSAVAQTADEELRPLIDFADWHVPECVAAAVQRRSFARPTPVQAQGWPLALAGRDLVGVAQTGSGKTLAYVLPALVHAHRQASAGRAGSNSSPTVLVLAPTRELAAQIAAVFGEYGRPSRLNCVSVFGGVGRHHQTEALRRGCHVLVATPGRLLDLAHEGCVSLGRCSYLVLDEADRMLDMGFEPQIRQIVQRVPPATHRQTLMWSATWPEEIRQLAGEFLRPSAVFVSVGAVDQQPTANSDIQQLVHVCEPFDKPARLSQLLRDIYGGGSGQQLPAESTEHSQHTSSSSTITADNNIVGGDSSSTQDNSGGGGGKTLIFCATKRQCDQLSMRLRTAQRYDQRHQQQQQQQSSLPACHTIHGDKSQAARQTALRLFSNARHSILVATDVAARGLDVDDIGHVINYDMPHHIDDYVHRIGRTGRCGRRGTAHSLLTADDAAVVGRQLMRVMSAVGQPPSQPVLELVEAASPTKPYYKQRGGGGGARGAGGWNNRARNQFRRSGYSSYMNDHDRAYRHASGDNFSRGRDGGRW